MYNSKDIKKIADNVNNLKLENLPSINVVIEDVLKRAADCAKTGSYSMELYPIAEQHKSFLLWEPVRMLNSYARVNYNTRVMNILRELGFEVSEIRISWYE